MQMTHETIVEFYATYGIKATFDYICLDSGFVYHNNKVALGGDRDDLPMSLHDLAHWLVASPQQRKLPNFGLGPHPNPWDTAKCELAMSASESINLEERASILHTFIVEKLFGFGAFQAIAIDLACESDPRRFDKSTWEQIAILQQAKLLNSKLEFIA
jgi:elongation factor P hydroxylase